jgi:hypothetical protein
MTLERLQPGHLIPLCPTCSDFSPHLDRGVVVSGGCVGEPHDSVLFSDAAFHLQKIEDEA